MKPIHAMEYCSALKVQEILQYVTTWMNVEDILLSEIIPSMKDIDCLSPLL